MNTTDILFAIGISICLIYDTIFLIWVIKTNKEESTPIKNSKSE